MISLTRLDCKYGYLIDWNIEIQDIDKNGFSYKLTAYDYHQYYTIQFHWIAIINEETLQVSYLKHIKTPNLMYTSGNNLEIIRVNFD
jgi:hypothetical protein